MIEAEMRMRELLAAELDKGVLRYMVDEVRRGEGYGSPDSFAIRAMLAAEAAAIEKCAAWHEAEALNYRKWAAESNAPDSVLSKHIERAKSHDLHATAIRALKEGASHVG